VRNLGYGDAERWRELFVAYLEFYETTRTEAELQHIWRQVTGGSPSVHALVAEDDGGVVGITHFSYIPSTWATIANCYLEDLFVAPASRGRGVGRALISEVERKARAFGCTELFWITANDNAVARRTYDKVAKRSIYVRYEIDLEKPSHNP
jgi:GNAT superfamily N-acetyltransferase